MRGLIVGLALVALAGCETNGQRAWNACQQIEGYAAWSECFDRHMPRQQQSRPVEYEEPQRAPRTTICTPFFGSMVCETD